MYSIFINNNVPVLPSLENSLIIYCKKWCELVNLFVIYYFCHTEKKTNNILWNKYRKKWFDIFSVESEQLLLPVYNSPPPHFSAFHSRASAQSPTLSNLDA